MTANESTPGDGENVTDASVQQVDFEAVGQELAKTELERYGMKLREEFMQAAAKAEQGDLDDADLDSVATALFGARHLVETLSTGGHVDPGEVDL
jgi:hypothetical protein